MSPTLTSDPTSAIHEVSCRMVGVSCVGRPHKVPSVSDVAFIFLPNRFDRRVTQTRFCSAGLLLTAGTVTRSGHGQHFCLLQRDTGSAPGMECFDE